MMGTVSDIHESRLFRFLYSGNWIITANRAHHEEPQDFASPLRSEFVAKKYFRTPLNERDISDLNHHLRRLGLNEHHYLFSANRHWLVMDQAAFSREIEPRMRGSELSR